MNLFRTINTHNNCKGIAYHEKIVAKWYVQINKNYPCGKKISFEVGSR